MQWDGGNIALATAALMGLAVWIINFCCTAHSEESVPGPESQSVAQSEIGNGKVPRVSEIERRLAVIRSSAHVLLENGETDDEVKRELCRFIIEEAEELSSSYSKL